MKSVAQRIAAINTECSGVWGQSGVTDWERQRLVEWADRETLSEKQEAVLSAVEKKVFGDDSEDA